MRALNVAHRGASAYAPENTLAAFNLALDMGADGIELDVKLTRDGVPIVLHDETVDRTTGAHGPIAGMTLAEVKRLDAGSWFDPRFRGERIPTLAEALRTVGKRGIVNIELKMLYKRIKGLEAAVLAVVEDSGSTDRTLFSSFNPLALKEMAALNPRLARGLLYAPNLPVYLRRGWLRPLARATALHPRHTMVDARLVRWAHGKGYAVNTWTVDFPPEMKRLADLGVDMIMTNKPDVLKQVLETR